MEQEQPPPSAPPPPGHVPSHTSAQPTPSVVYAPPPPAHHHFYDGRDTCKFLYIIIFCMIFDFSYAVCCFLSMEFFGAIQYGLNDAPVIEAAEKGRAVSGVAAAVSILCILIGVFGIVVSGSLNAPKGRIAIILWLISALLYIVIAGTLNYFFTQAVKEGVRGNTVWLARDEDPVPGILQKGEDKWDMVNNAALAALGIGILMVILRLIFFCCMWCIKTASAAGNMPFPGAGGPPPPQYQSPAAYPPQNIA